MRLLYLHPALVKPSLPAPKPLRSLQIRYVLRPSGKNSPYVQKLRAPSCLRRNLRHEDAAFIREAYALRAALFSLRTGCTALLWPHPKAGPSGNICPLRVRLLVDFPGCTQFLADIRRGIRRKLIVSITELALLLGLHAARAYPKSQRAPVGIRPLPSGSSCMNGSHVLQAVFRPVSSRVALWRMGIFP